MLTAHLVGVMYAERYINGVNSGSRERIVSQPPTNVPLGEYGDEFWLGFSCYHYLWPAE